MTDGEVAEHGQRHGQPHGDRVSSDVESLVEEEVADPGGRVAAVLVRTGVAVEVGGVRDVERHCEQVGDGERCQQEIGWTDEGSTRQHGNVHGVRRGSEGAGDEAEVAVDTLVPDAELHQRRVGDQRLVVIWTMCHVDDGKWQRCLHYEARIVHRVCQTGERRSAVDEIGTEGGKDDHSLTADSESNNRSR